MIEALFKQPLPKYDDEHTFILVPRKLPSADLLLWEEMTSKLRSIFLRHCAIMFDPPLLVSYYLQVHPFCEKFLLMNTHQSMQSHATNDRRSVHILDCRGHLLALSSDPAYSLAEFIGASPAIDHLKRYSFRPLIIADAEMQPVEVPESCHYCRLINYTHLVSVRNPHHSIRFVDSTLLAPYPT